MGSDRHYSDDEVMAQAAELATWATFARVAAMLRSLLADRVRLEADRAALLAEVMEARRIFDSALVRLSDDAYDAARAATDARLGGEVTG